MKLTRQSIIKQLCYELLEWKALNLRPETILGSRDPQPAYQLYRYLLSEAPSTIPTDILSHLHSYVFSRSMDSDFYKHFGVYNPRVVNLWSPPLPPIFCATSLFSAAIAQNTIPSDGYDDAAQIELITNNLHFAYPSEAARLNGVTIAAENNNEEMVSFLLHPSLPMFNLTHEYLSLLDNPLVTHPPVRQAIFRACGERFIPEMMNELITRMTTADEWIALCQALNAAQRQDLLNNSTQEIWSKLNPTDAQIKIILPLMSEEAKAQLYVTLLSTVSKLTDAPLVLSLMDRMPPVSRQLFVLSSGERVNTLFSQRADLNACLILLGYKFDAAGLLKLDHLHLADQPILDLVHRLNQTIWDSTLDIHMKLGYFHVTQQLLLANPDGRLECTRAYEDCIQQCESMLRDQNDAGLNWFWRVLNAVGRFFGFIADFPVTLEARNLLGLVNNAVAVNPQFHAVILDLSRVILPDDAPESQRRKNAIGALTSSNYTRFWQTMSREERALLLSDQDRFQQLLQTFSDDASIESLLLGLSENMRNELLDTHYPAALLSLLQMPRVSMPILLGCLGDVRKNQLLRDPVWFGEIMTQPPESVTRCFLVMFDRHILDEIKNSLPHMQSALVKGNLNRLTFLGQYFAPSIPLNKTPQEIGGLIEAMHSEKLLPFWTTFLHGRVITVEEMAQLLPVINDAEKRRMLITHQLITSPIRAWSDDLFILLPDMTPAQQAHTLSVMTADDLLRLNRAGKIEAMLSILTPGNDEAFLDRYRDAFPDSDALNCFLDQLLPAHLELLLSKPPFEFFKIMAPDDLRGLIRALRHRSDNLGNDQQWQIFAPKLLGMAQGIYGPADPVVMLLQQHVPESDRNHVLNLLHTASEDDLTCLLDSYLNTEIVQALMLHKKLDFNAITLDGIREIMQSDLNADIKPRLIVQSDELFHGLIQSHLEKLKTQVLALEASIVTAQTGLLALMVPHSGVFSYSFSQEVKVVIGKKWDAIVLEIEQLTQHHAELVSFCSIRHYDEAMVALKPIHEKISYLVVNVVDPFIAKYRASISKTGLKVTYLRQDTDAIKALTQVETTLQQMDKNEETRLLAAIPDAAIIHKMRTDDQLKDFFALIVTQENSDRFLERCRNLLTTQNLWREITPSSLSLLSEDAPKSLFASVSEGDFKSLVRAFSHLTPDQWNALAPNLLALRTQHFNQGDVLVSLLHEDVRAPAHLHVLNLIRTTPDEAQVQRLLGYLTSDVVREYKKYNQIDDATINIAHLPDLEREAESWFVDDVRNREEVLQRNIENLKTTLVGLKTELDAPKKTGWTFFSSPYNFNGESIKEWLAQLPLLLDKIKEDLDVLNHLYSIKSDQTSNDFMNALTEDFKSKFMDLRKFMNSDNGQAKLKDAPWCEYRDHKKMHANDCLNSICKELSSLAGSEDELDMSVTLSGSAAVFE